MSAPASPYGDPAFIFPRYGVTRTGLKKGRCGACSAFFSGCQASQVPPRVVTFCRGRGTPHIAALLAVCDHTVLARVPGEETHEPVYGLPAKWIAIEHREAAMSAGALVFNPISVIGSHLAEVARANAAALVGRQELQTLLEHLRATVPALVKDFGTDAFPLPILHKTVGLLLRERAWPRDPVRTLEAIVDASTQTRDPRDLAEARRVIIP